MGGGSVALALRMWGLDFWDFREGTDAALLLDTWIEEDGWRERIGCTIVD